MIQKKTNLEIMSTMMYYATTTLLSVGYGDYYPISTFEKLIATFVLLVGVTIYSALFGKFMACI
jgi:voltage-gated potassium channel